jgi:hypothetical protein
MSPSTTTVYVRWRPEELAIGILGQSPRVKEPPRVVVTDRGHLCAVGLEATEAVAKCAHSLIHFRSVRESLRTGIGVDGHGVPPRRWWPFWRRHASVSACSAATELVTVSSDSGGA